MNEHCDYCACTAAHTFLISATATKDSLPGLLTSSYQNVKVRTRRAQPCAAADPPSAAGWGSHTRTCPKPARGMFRAGS